MSDILKAIHDDIEAGAEWTKPKPEPPKRAPLDKISKAEAKRRAAKLRKQEGTVETRLEHINALKVKLKGIRRDLQEQCPHEWGEEHGFPYYIYDCVICGESEIV